MAKKKENRFSFTEATLRALPTPSTGRSWWYDDKARGLCVCKTAAGTTTLWFYKWLDGRPQRERLGEYPEISVKQARDAVETRLGKIANGIDPFEQRRTRRKEPTIKELWEHWILYAKTHKKPVSAYEDELKYKVFLSPWANRRLSTIQKADVQALHASIGRTYEETVKGKTVRKGGIYAANRMLALLRAMFNKADELGYRGDNPAKGIKLFKEQSRDRFLQPNELQSFFAALEAEGDIVRDFYLMLLLTGARRANVQSMAWVDVDLQSAYWRIPETKAGMPVIIPLVVPALAILTARTAGSFGSPWVFPGRNGKHMANPKDAWKRICNRAGLTNLHPHDLRRSLGSWMAGQNTSLPIIGRALGHKTAVATMVYSRLSLDPIRDAVDRATTAMLTAGGQTKLLEANSTPITEGTGDE